MTSKKIVLKSTLGFEKELDKIEDFIFNQRDDPQDVARFLDQLEHLSEFIRNNPMTPAIDIKTGDRSWGTSDGNYRVFYNAQEIENEITVTLTDIDACRAANLDRFPEHQIKDQDTFQTEE